MVNSKHWLTGKGMDPMRRQQKCLGSYLYIPWPSRKNHCVQSWRIGPHSLPLFFASVLLPGGGGGGSVREKSAKIVGKRALQFQLYIPHKLMIQAAFSWFIFSPQPWPGSLVALLTRSVLGHIVFVYCWSLPAEVTQVLRPISPRVTRVLVSPFAWQIASSPPPIRYHMVKITQRCPSIKYTECCIHSKERRRVTDPPPPLFHTPALKTIHDGDAL